MRFGDAYETSVSVLTLQASLLSEKCQQLSHSNTLG